MFRYAPDTVSILSLFQTYSPAQRYSRHERLSVAYSDFRSQLQFGYTPDTEVILLLIQISTSDTVQIHSRHGCHSITHSNLFPSPEILQTRMSFCCLFRFQVSDTIRIHFRHGSHSDTHSDLTCRYISNTLQTRTSF